MEIVKLMRFFVVCLGFMSHGLQAGDFDDDEYYAQQWRRLQDRGRHYPLHRAAKLGSIKDCEEHLKTIPVDSLDDDSQTALHHAAQSCSYGTIKLLVEKGANVNARDTFGRTPCSYAVTFLLPIFTDPNYFSTVSYLLEKGSEVNSGGGFRGETLLHVMVRGYSSCSPQVIDLLRKYGADVNAKDNNNETPLHYLMRPECPSDSFIQKLVDVGADVNAKNKDEDTALHIAARNPAGLKAMRVLLAAGRKRKRGFTASVMLRIHVLIRNGASYLGL